MSQKLLVPLGVLALLVMAALAVWMLLPDDTPRVNVAGDNTPETRPDNGASPLDLNPDDFQAEKLTPDPVVSERPPEPFKPAPNSRRFVVSGRVVSPGGAGIANARVQFFGEQKLRDWRGAGYTDAGGYYRMLAWAPDLRGTMASDSYGRVAASTPDGALGVGESTLVPDGPEVAMPDVVLAEGRVIEGQVLTEDGLPVPGAEVTARSSGRVEVATLRGRTPSVTTRPYVTTVIADSDGRYRLRHMPGGEYGLTVSGGYAGEELAQTRVDLRQETSGWQDLRVRLTNQVRGTVVDQAGQPVAGAVVQLRLKAADDEDAAAEDGAKTTADVIPRRDGVRRFDDAARLQPLGRTACVTDAAGRFGFNNRPEGDYELVTRLGESEVLLDGVMINQADYRLEVNVNTLVAGIVRDAQTGLPVESFDARLLPGDGETGVSPFERVNEDGRFALHPGGAYLFANPPVRPMRVRISAPGYAPGVVNIGNLGDGEARRNVDVELAPLCDLTLRLSLEGRGLDLEPVALLFDDRLAYDGSTDEVGMMRLPEVAPQTYRVRLIRADGTKLEGELTVPARRDASLEVKLVPVK
ncbi:MAG: carboxypeptidase-like regulatory domain-containing protein [Planctomycetes bacterium]|nr:carboxypeptidase-like regulatory domain-containing protein [Planctomycetota bacterium]